MAPEGYVPRAPADLANEVDPLAGDFAGHDHDLHDRSVCRYSAGGSTIGKENVVGHRVAAPTEEDVVAAWEMTGTADALAELEGTWTKGDAPTTTGLKSFDELLGGGLRAGDVIALAGAAGSSKSALAGSVAYDAAQAGAVVLVASVEMPPSEVHARWLALELFRQAPANAWAIRFGDVQSLRS